MLEQKKGNKWVESERIKKIINWNPSEDSNVTEKTYDIYESLLHSKNAELISKLRDKYKGENVLVTSGYHDDYYKTICHIFGITACKLNDTISLISSSLDFLNKNTDDCFFTLPGQNISILSTVDKSKRISLTTS